MIDIKLDKVSLESEAHIDAKINFKTKPLGSLGTLENIAKKIALIQQREVLVLNKPSLIVFAGDHGIANEGVSAFPQEVTFQMVMNFLNGGAAINVFSKTNKIDLSIVDAGVNFDFNNINGLLDQKVAKGTKSFLSEKAMSSDALSKCMRLGAEIVQQHCNNGCNVIGFGEMGIGNTSAASCIMSALLHIPIADCVGLGTGVDEKGYYKKVKILNQAIDFHGVLDDPLEVLQTYGGFEMAQMCGAMLKAAENKMLILLDGFIASASMLVAYSLFPQIGDYVIASHLSDEKAHRKMLQYMNLDPVLDLKMRLGEGTGAALVYPILQNAVAFYNDMASFESAGISGKDA